MANRSIQECLGENIKKLRTDRGYTQRSFAEKFDLSISFLQNIEAGKKWVGPETIARLARAFKVPESKLFEDCQATPKPDPRLALAVICEALGVDLASLRQ